MENLVVVCGKIVEKGSCLGTRGVENLVVVGGKIVEKKLLFGDMWCGKLRC